jgi:hypothetical protein
MGAAVEGNAARGGARAQGGGLRLGQGTSMRDTCESVEAEESMFFFEKKNQKTFDCLRSHRPARVSGEQLTKVFWFFFSKNNILPAPAW